MPKHSPMNRETQGEGNSVAPGAKRGSLKSPDPVLWKCSARSAWVGSYPYAPTLLGTQAPWYPPPPSTYPPRYLAPLCLSWVPRGE